jgi:ABC-type tungstate transport system permease subunit
MRFRQRVGCGAQSPQKAREPCDRDIGGAMGQALNAASAMPAYTLSDRGTCLSDQLRIAFYRNHERAFVGKTIATT